MRKRKTGARLIEWIDRQRDISVSSRKLTPANMRWAERAQAEGRIITVTTPPRARQGGWVGREGQIGRDYTLAAWKKRKKR